MHQGFGQSTPAVLARRRLLADVGSARVDAQTLDGRAAQFDTLRLRLVKVAARVVEMKTMIRVHLPTSCPGKELLRFALSQMPRLVT